VGGVIGTDRPSDARGGSLGQSLGWQSPPRNVESDSRRLCCGVRIKVVGRRAAASSDHAYRSDARRVEGQEVVWSTLTGESGDVNP
jgi:hypothetical protein